MTYPEKAIIEFKSSQDYLAFVAFAESQHLHNWLQRLATRTSWYESLCGRFEGDQFVSFGSTKLYEDPFWDRWKQDLSPLFHYCSATDYIAYVLQDADTIPDGNMPDLDDLL